MSTKEHIAVRGKNRVAKAVDLKVKVLRSWVRFGLPWQTTASGSPARDSDGEQVLVGYPADIKAFCAWKGRVVLVEEKSNKDVEVAYVARSTLNQPTYDLTRRSISDLLGLVHERATSQLESANKGTVIKRLTEELKHANRILEQQELDVVRLRRQADQAAVELGKERATRQRNEEELNRKLSELQAKNAALIAASHNISPLKRV